MGLRHGSFTFSKKGIVNNAVQRSPCKCKAGTPLWDVVSTLKVWIDVLGPLTLKDIRAIYHHKCISQRTQSFRHNHFPTLLDVSINQSPHIWRWTWLKVLTDVINFDSAWHWQCVVIRCGNGDLVAERGTAIYGCFTSGINWVDWRNVWVVLFATA